MRPEALASSLASDPGPGMGISGSLDEISAVKTKR